MATVMDLGLLNYFVPIIVFLLVLVIVYALLEKTNFFPGNNYVNLLVAFCVALLFIVVPELSSIVAIATPWFVILFIFLIFLILVFLFMGVDPEAVAGVFGGGNLAITWAIIIVAFAIFGYAFTQVYGEQIHDITAGADNSGEDDLVQSVGKIIFTPKVLGMLILITIAGLAVRFISPSPIG